nr:MAG TPA: hypothetical protein [Caudoviricetes sp.]
MFGGLSKLFSRAAANHGDDVLARLASNYGDDVANSISTSIASNGGGVLDNILPAAQKTSGIANVLREGGERGMNAPMNLTRADVRKLKGRGGDPTETITKLYDRTGTSDVKKLEDLAEQLMGSKDGKNKGLVSSVIDDMRTNFSRVGDPQNYVDLNDLRETIQRTASDAKLESIIQDKLGITGTKNLDPIGIAKAFRNKAADYRGGATPNKNMANALEELGREIDTRIDNSVDPRNIAGGWEIIKDNLLHAQQSAVRSGDKVGAEAFKRLAKEIADVPSNERTIQAMRSKLKDFVDIKEINRLTDNAGGGGALSAKLKSLPVVGDVVDATLGKPLERLSQKTGEKMLKLADAFDSGKAQNTLKKGALIGGGIGALSLLGSGGNNNNNGLPPVQSVGSAMTSSAETPNNNKTMKEMTQPQQELTVGGYSRDQLENAYVAALMDNNAKAAKALGTMIDMLDNKETRADKRAATNAGKKNKKGGDMETAMSQLNSMLGNYEAQGVAGGTLTNLLNSATGGAYNPKIAAYNDQSQSVGISLLKALGESGALSESDMARAKALIPTNTDSQAKAQAKLKTLKAMLSSVSE